MKNNILLQPVVSEKSYVMSNALNKYVFLVSKDATKIDVQHAVEKEYKVTVTDVNMVTRPGKIKRDYRTNRKFRREDEKKAIVTLKKGDKIDEFLNI